MTFAEQAEQWINDLTTRRRSPIKASSAAAFRSQLNWLLPRIGPLPLESITNATLRDLAAQLQRQPKTVACYLNVVKAVVESPVDPTTGDPLYIRKWNPSFIDAPIVINQKQPCFSPKQVRTIVDNSGELSLLCQTAAGTGLRINELRALEVQHLNESTLIVEQSRWGNRVWAPKTRAGVRQVDLCEGLAQELQELAGCRPSGYLFPDRSYNTLLAQLHRVLRNAGIPLTGFHAFRRFRETHLSKMNVSRGLQKYWMGHAAEDITDTYDKIGRDIDHRRAEAERVGLGF